MPRLLKNLRIRTIGSVDRPANKEAQAVLMKRADDEPGTDEETMMKKLFSVVKGLFGPGAKDYNTVTQEQFIEDDLWDKTRTLRESLESILADTTLSDKQSAIANSLQQFFSDLVGSVSKAGKKISTSRLTMLKDMQAKLQQLIAEAEATPNPGDLTKRSDVDVPPIKMEDLPEEVRKGLESIGTLTADLKKREDENTALQKKLDENTAALAKAQEDLAKAQEDLAKATDEGKTKEYIAKAAGFKNLSVSPEELGKLMRSVSENKATPEDIAKLEGILKAADEGISKGNLFGEVGRGGAASSDALAKAEALAGEIVSKDTTMTKEMALTKVWRENPDLYKQYMAEHRAAAREAK